MAEPTFVQEVAQRVISGTSNSVSFERGNRDGDLIVVYVLWSNTGDVTLTDTNGNTYRAVGAPTTWNGGRAHAAVFYAADIGAGPNVVTARFTDPITAFGIVYAHEYANVATVDPLDGSTSTVGTTTTVNSGALRTTIDGGLLFVAAGSTDKVQLTDPTFTTRSDRWDNLTADASGQPTGTHTVAGTHNGTAWVTTLVAFKPATTTSSSTTTTTLPSSTTTTTPGGAVAEPTFVQEVAQQVISGTSNSVSFERGNRDGDLIVVYVLWSNTGDVTLTDTNGNTYRAVGAPTTWNGGRAHAAVFYAADIGAGPNVVTARFTDPITAFGIVYAHEYANVATVDPLDGSTSTVGTTTTVNGALRTTIDGGLLFVAAGSTDKVQLTDPTFTARSDRWDNLTADASGQPAGTHTVAGTHNGTAWVTTLVAFKPATTTSSSTTTTTLPSSTTTTTPGGTVAEPTFVQEVAQQVISGTSNSVSFERGNRDGDLIVVYVLWSNTGDVTLTDTNGNTYRAVGAPTTWNGGRARAAVFYAADIGAGPNVVTARFTDPITAFGIVYAHEYANVATVDPLDGSTSTVGTTTTVNAARSRTTIDGGLLFVAAGSTDKVQLTDPTFTTRSDRWDNLTADASGQPAGTHTVAGTHNGTAWVTTLVAFKPAS